MKLPDAPFPTPPGVVYRSGTNRGVCPRCHVLVVPTSRVVRLFQSEHPHATLDLRRSADTGEFYMWDHRPISPKPKWFVHERCYLKHYGMPSLPPEVEAACARYFDANLAALAAQAGIEDSGFLTGSYVESILAKLEGEDVR